jgi:hypothetical protein
VINQLRAFLLERGLVFARTPAKLKAAVADSLENAESDLTHFPTPPHHGGLKLLHRSLHRVNNGRKNSHNGVSATWCYESINLLVMLQSNLLGNNYD